MTNSKQASQPEVESEGELQPKAQSADKGQLQPQAQAQSQAQPQVQAKAQTQAQARVKTQPQAQAKTQPQAQAKTQPQAQAKTQPQEQAKGQLHAQAETHPQAQAEAQPPAQAKAQSPAKANVSSQAQNQAKAQLQPQPELTLEFLKRIFDEREEDIDILSSDLNGIRKELQPFNSWKNLKVMGNDNKREAKYVSAIVNAAKGKKHARFGVRMVSLAAKNRAEAISDKSDFYPASIGFVGSVLAMLAIIASNSHFMKVIVGIFIPVLTLLFISVRLNTRRQVADLKIIGNIMDAVEKQLPDSPKAPVMQNKAKQGQARRKWLNAPVSANARARLCGKLRGRNLR